MHIARRLIVPLGLLALLAGCSKPAVVDEPVRAVRSITLQASGATVQHDYAAEIRASWSSAWSTRAMRCVLASCWRRSMPPTWCWAGTPPSPA